ncbi:MAG: DUF2779 domain-containing protein [Dissulfurispiraceae bacterium]
MTNENKNINTYLSKSLFLRGLQCPKSLYLHKYHPELRDEISDQQKALFRTGTDVGRYAQQLFPDGIEIPYDDTSHIAQLEMTQAEINKGTTTLYEAAFSHDDVFVKVDILHKDQEGWKFFEVKSTTDIQNKTGIEKVYLDDAAIQFYVLKGSGFPVSKIFLVHINNQYVRHGEIDPKSLFIVTDVTDAVKENQPYIVENIVKLKETLRGDMPDIDIGEYCEAPYRCDFQGYCRQHIPLNSVFALRRRGVNKYKLYRQGIIEMKDIPLDILNKAQRLQVEAFLNKAQTIDKDAIRTFMDKLFYPRCFLDFETFQSAVPLFDGTKPYQQIPFQYSLHIQESEDTDLKHFEYLAEPCKDPRRELLIKLIDLIPEKSCIITYTNFETQILRGLAESCPEYKVRIEGIIENIWDLSLPFNKMDYYHYQMNGSYSIKDVLPVLVSEMTYDGMAISNGGMAVDAYFAMCQLSDQSEINSIRRNLLDYCKLDTLAMVKILDSLKRML